MPHLALQRRDAQAEQLVFGGPDHAPLQQRQQAQAANLLPRLERLLQAAGGMIMRAGQTTVRDKQTDGHLEGNTK